MTSCLPFLKLHSWSLDQPKHPRAVFNVRNSLCPVAQETNPR